MCCGKNKSRLPSAPFEATPHRARTANGLTSTFEYIGRTGLTVAGPMSGTRYRFDRPGARLEVDLRDREWLMRVPVLRMIS